MRNIPAVFNWSGGKDSTLALHYILHQRKFKVIHLLTSVSDAFNRVSMHGVRECLLIEQANALGLSLIQLRLPEMPDMETYEQAMYKQLDGLRAEGIEYAIFGDIFLEDLKVYRERQLDRVGMKAVFPLWKLDSLALVTEFIRLGYKAIVVCAQERLKDFCGRVLDESFLNDLPSDVDPCGENGEFHSFVFDGPLFKQKIKFELGEKVFRTFPSSNEDDKPTGYWYIDLF
jgi:uncharacterized protein (TIGR00290 family)